MQADYPPSYLAGVQLFNRHDFFEAHEVWEDLWAEEHGAAHLFLQGMIQIAVGLCHFCNGNLRGALKLYRTSRRYHDRCGETFIYGWGLSDLWTRMERCSHEILHAEELTSDLEADPDLFPTLKLNPPPEEWPDVEDFLHEEE